MMHQAAWNTIFSPAASSTPSSAPASAAPSDGRHPGPPPPSHQRNYKRPRPGGGRPTGQGRGRGPSSRPMSQRHDRDQVNALVLERAARLAAMPTTTPEQIEAYRQARAKAFPKKATIEAAGPEAAEPGAVTDAAAVKVVGDGVVEDEKEASRRTPAVRSDEDELNGFCWRYLRSQCRRGRQCQYRHDPDLRAKYVEDEIDAPRHLGKLRCPRPATKLLRHLLQGEIDRQHDLVVNCFRHLVGHRFLQGV